MSMTNINMKMNIRKPFLLSPAAKDYLWGGSKLKEDYNKNIDINPLAETWECSTHPDGPSIIASGSFEGLTLAQLVHLYPEILGEKNQKYNDLPILVKLIDAKEKLSVQVHPDDEYAFKYENESLGKTEMWYVLDADSDANIVYGFNSVINKRIFKNAVKEKKTEKYLNKVGVKKGDFYCINPGVVHAIGSGVVIAEIQENSNLTYRIYDYNRLDKNGKERELHIDKALDVINYSYTGISNNKMKLVKYEKNCSKELINRCKYFEVWKYSIDNKNIDIITNEKYFSVILCIDGKGTLSFKDGKIDFLKGSCIFIPANSVGLILSGKCEFLKINS